MGKLERFRGRSIRQYAVGTVGRLPRPASCESGPAGSQTSADDGGGLQKAASGLNAWRSIHEVRLYRIHAWILSRLGDHGEIPKERIDDDKPVEVLVRLQVLG
jgi:hypothetical protein